MKNFTKHFEKAVAHNQANDKKKSFHVTYKKLNGRTVKRKIDPVSLRNNVVVAFDHKRQALRSFKIERLKGMEKAAFWKGFEKSALDKNRLAIGAGVAGAGLLGGMIGHRSGRKKGEREGFVAGSLHERTKKHLGPDEKILHYAINKKTNDKMFITNKGRRLVYKYNAEKVAGVSTETLSKIIANRARKSGVLHEHMDKVVSKMVGKTVDKGITNRMNHRFSHYMSHGENILDGTRDGHKKAISAAQKVFKKKPSAYESLKELKKSPEFNARLQAKKMELDKKASGESALYHGVELAGLGILAAPSVMHMAKMKPMSEKNYHRAEVAGLGILAAPSMVALAKKFKPMKGLINKIPSVI